MFGFQGGVNVAAEHLAETFRRLVPLQPVRPMGDSVEAAKALVETSGDSLANFYQVARSERDRNRFGVIGLARVAFGVQQRLLAAGYPPRLVKQVLFAMLTSAVVGKQR